jgi:hypothetical protein
MRPKNRARQRPGPRQLDTTFSLLPVMGTRVRRSWCWVVRLRERQTGERLSGPRRVPLEPNFGIKKPGLLNQTRLSFLVDFLVGSRSNTLKQAVTTHTACVINQQLATLCDRRERDRPGSSPVSRSKITYRHSKKLHSIAFHSPSGLFWPRYPNSLPLPKH